MGRHLVQHCKTFSQSIQKCEVDLKSLPEGPTWSLIEELVAEEKVSRLSQAVISQPLCTALQIALVDLLKTVGMEFAAVVGHSSGETGAAYAAGLLSRRHAMGIAYYRGQVAHLAKGPGGKAGGMIAAALTFQDAKSLCSEARFKGRGQILFPGAGYVSIAVEASKAFVQGRPIKLVEARDMNIPKALVIGEDKGVEVVFTMRSQTLHTSVSDGSSLEAEFVACSCSYERVLDKTCDARLFIHLGPTGSEDLPANPISQTELTPLDTDRFYRAVSEIDLGYDGAFRALHSISRSWGHAKASASWSSDDIAIGCSLHPAVLDVAFQVGLGTFLSTAEKSMRSPLLPVGIRRAFINPNQNYEDEPGSTNIEIEAMMSTANAGVVEVDISLCAKKTNETQSCGIQIDGLILKAIAEPQPSEDRNLFVKTIWDVDSAYGLAVTPPTPANEAASSTVIDACERITLFYMQNLIRELSAQDLKSASWYHQELFSYIHTTLSTTREKRHAILREGWLDDDRETILKLIDEHPESVDIEMLVAVELPHGNMHYLDFDRPEAWNADVLVRHVLLMAFTLASSTTTQEMLWSEEPEVLVKGDEILVPRIVPDHVANETLNAKRRKISKLVTTERITIDSSDPSSQLPQLLTGDSLSVPERYTAVDVKFSLALQTGVENPCFLCFGRVQSSGQLADVGEVLVLSAIDSSTVVAPTESLLECCDAQAINGESLVGTASALIALQVVRRVPQHGTTLVFGATVGMAHAISAVAAGTGHSILFVAVDSVDEKNREDWIMLHPRAAARVARRLIPKDTSLVINLSKENLETIVEFLPCFASFRPMILEVFFTNLARRSLLYWAKRMTRTIHQPKKKPANYLP
ncbi:hypothetical protein VdG2_05349 [Verticillium dahliae VDG2]|nr:hypothetical protein VdG2_05349 [Verticillium dahliae VDG2]